MIVGTQSVTTRRELILVFENHALASEGTTITASSNLDDGNLAVSNLGNPALDLAYRSWSLRKLARRGIATVRIRFFLGRPRSVDWVSLHRSNIRRPIKVRFYRAPGPKIREAPVFESPWIDPVVRATPAEFEDFSDMPWDLGLQEESLERWQQLFQLDTPILADRMYQNVRTVDIIIDISSGTNAGVDYLQFGLPFVGPAFRPRINMLLDWEIGVMDRSEIHRTESGALHGRRRSIARTLAFTLGYIDRDEAFPRILTNWMRRHGKLGRVFVWPEPHHRRYFYDTAMVAAVTNLPAVAMANLDWPAAKGILLEELE